MQLKEIVSRMTVLAVQGSLHQSVTGISFDARGVTPGHLFFSLAADPAEGYAEIQAALGRGASAVVCRRGQKMRKRDTCIEVPEARLALAEASAAFHGNPGDSLRLILIPGDCGHSQLAFLVKQLVEGAGVKTALIGTIRHDLGGRVLPASDRFPESADLQNYMAQALQAGCSACIIEAPLEMLSPERFAGIPFDLVILTDLPADLPAGFARNLGAILRGGASSRKALVAVANWDQENIRELQLSRCDALVRYGMEREAEVTAADAEFTMGGSHFILQLPGTRFPCKTDLPGRHNLSHLLAAAGTSLCLDIDPALLQRSCAGLRNVPGSLERIQGGGSVAVFVDGARHREELRQVLSSLGELAEGRLILTFGCDHRTSGRTRFEIGKMLGGLADYVVLTSDNPGREPVEQICSAIAQGIEQNSRASYHFQPDRAVAIREALARAEPGDLVLLAGKGERTRQELCYTVIPFHDRECAEEYLGHAETPPVETNRMLAETVPH